MSQAEQLEFRLCLDAQLVFDLNPMPLPFGTDAFSEYRGDLYFGVNYADQNGQTFDAFADISAELWKTDGTAAGTQMVHQTIAITSAPRPHDPGSDAPQREIASTEIKRLHQRGDDLLFLAQTGFGASTDLDKTIELIAYDGEQTRSLGTLADRAVYAWYPGNVAQSATGELFFDVGVILQNQLWKTDGTLPGTVKLASGRIDELTPFGDKVFYTLGSNACDGDLDGDGIIAFSDFVILANHFGTR